MMTSNHLPCPIIGCKYANTTTSQPFHTITILIRHLQSTDHKNSLHLIDHSVCHEIKLYTCSHLSCNSHPGHFFASKRALDDHNTMHHPALHHYHSSTPISTYADTIFNSHASSHLTNNWTHGINYILSNYDRDPPHYRSTWRRFLDGNNKKRFTILHAKLIETIIHSQSTNDSAPFWWLLFHLELLILAPSHLDSNTSQCTTIRRRLDDFQSGNIQTLCTHALSIRNRNTHRRPPHNNGNKAAQIAADADNYRTAMARLNTNNPIATIGRHNIPNVTNLYSEPVPPQPTHPPPLPLQSHHLPGDICNTIKCSPKHKGTGLNADSIDIFNTLVKLNDTHINQTIQELFGLVYHGQVPTIAKKFFTDTYLFCLHKDPNDKSKLRPIGIPTAIRRIIASHVAPTMKDKFAATLLPYNYSVGIDGGMDFIIKAMQLSIEHHIIHPQEQNILPTRSALFIDLTNMFNQVSRQELFDIIHSQFPELTPLTNLIYDTPSTVHYKWNDTSWKTISMKEGVNQGCPLSSTFAALILNRVLQPIDTLLRNRAQQRLHNGDPGDEGYGGISHLFAWVDDISANIPHIDITTFLTYLDTLGRERSCYINPGKS